jgi:hypothetical protein
MHTNNVEAETFIAFKAMRYARRELRRAIRYAEANPTEEARLKRTDALVALNRTKRRYEELAIMRDVVWQQNIKRHE